MATIEEQLVAWIEEAHELRYEFPELGSQNESLTELHAKLIRFRGNLDRLEQIVVNLVKLNGKMKQVVADARGQADDAWDRAATKKNIGYGFDGPAPRERYADYNTRTLHEQVEARQAEKVGRQVETALEVARILFRGLDSARRDLETRIRLISLETSLGG